MRLWNYKLSYIHLNKVANMKFKEALTISDHNFYNILEIMKLKRDPHQIDSLHNVLCTINHIVDYYLDKDDDQLNVVVSYFPVCSEFAQEVSEEFICLKFGLYVNEEWQSIVANRLNHSYFYIQPDVKTKKQQILAKENYLYEKKLSEILKRTDKEYYGHGETLIYSDYINKEFSEFKESQKSYNRKFANKYWYLSHAITDYSSSQSSCPLQIIYHKAEDLYDDLVSNNHSKKIENMVAFPMRSPDGRYSDFCSDFFQKPYLEDFVNNSLGLRNVFFFCFSRKPYRLRRLFDFKQRMKEHIQINDDLSYDFISFTYKESQILKGQKPINYFTIDIGKDKNEIQQDYELLLDDITNGLDYEILKRNEMSLCISADSSDIYSTKLLDETETDEILLGEILSQNHSLWKQDAEIKIKHFVFHREVFVVLGNNISHDLQLSFKKILINQYGAFNVEFGTFNDLRGYNENGVYCNHIKCNRILIMSYRNDCTESIFHKYPNSFDPYCINEGQKLLVIRNYFYLRNYFDWGQYNYMKALKKVLKSDFRASNMKLEIQEFKKPSKKIPTDTREDELDRNSYTRNAPQMKIFFERGFSQSYLRSEWVLYKSDSCSDVAPLYDIPEILESNKKVEIQPLTPLIKQINKTFIDSEKDKDSRNERMFKEQESYGLSQKEIESDVQLWKILLAKKVNEFSERAVYEEIMSHFNERYKVSFHSFKRWLEPDYGIPRARKMQKYLIENYLGIRPPYINLIRRIKERTKSDTESITLKIREFLRVFFTTKDTNNAIDYHSDDIIKQLVAKLYSKSNKVIDYLSDDIKDLLDISDTDDIVKIILSVIDLIKLEKIKSIS